MPNSNVRACISTANCKRKRIQYVNECGIDHGDLEFFPKLQISMINPTFVYVHRYVVT